MIIGRVFFGVDVREHGSGNVGATNVFRVLGARAAVPVFLLDALKGSAGVFVASLLAPASFSPAGRDWIAIAAAMATVLGHSYSPFIRFGGGKGVATAAGALLLVTPLAVPILLGVWIVVVALSRMVSLGSVIIAALYPVLCVLLYRDRTPVIAFSVVAAALVIWRHHSNVRRIIRGEEARVSWRRAD